MNRDDVVAATADPPRPKWIGTTSPRRPGSRVGVRTHRFVLTSREDGGGEYTHPTRLTGLHCTPAKRWVVCPPYLIA